MARQRHNIGFMVVDRIAARHGFSPWRQRFRGLVAEGTLGNQRVLLLKPQTYMNDSGASVQPAAGFFKLEPAAITAFHDELDLAPGKVRVKRGGGAAGHNGLRSMDRILGTPEYWRVRLGIGHPGDKARVHGWVLGDFHKTDAAWLADLLDAVADAAPMLAGGKPEDMMTRIALLTQQAGAPPAGPGPNGAKPDGAKPRAAKSDIAKLNITSPGTAKPDTTKPGAAKPDIAKLNITSPGIAKPDTAKPGAAKPDTIKPGIANPGIANPGISGPGISGPGISGPGITGPGITTAARPMAGRTAPSAAEPGDTKSKEP